jgi:HNH endonuclease
VSLDPPLVEDALILQRAVEMLLDHDRDRARATLRQLSTPDRMRAGSFAISSEVGKPIKGTRPNCFEAVRVFEADGWRCRYCEYLLVVPGVIELIGVLCAREFPFKNHHMAKATTHPAAEGVYPNVDHFRAVSIGGTGEGSNLVTACTLCNERKGNRAGWPLLPRRAGDWTGLTERYRGVLALADVPPRQFHRDWLAALHL